MVYCGDESLFIAVIEMLIVIVLSVMVMLFCTGGYDNDNNMIMKDGFFYMSKFRNNSWCHF